MKIFADIYLKKELNIYQFSYRKIIIYIAILARNFKHGMEVIIPACSETEFI